VPEHNVAIVFVTDSGVMPANSQAVELFLKSEGTAARGFHLQPSSRGNASSADSNVTQPLLIDELGLPEESVFPYRYSFSSWSTALMPWVAEHLFQKGFSEVVCLDPVAWAQRDSGEPHGFSVARWLSVLDDHLHAVFAANQSAAALRNIDTVRQYLSRLRDQRELVAQQALGAGQVVFGMGVGRPPENLLGKVCVVEGAAPQPWPEELQTAPILGPEVGNLRNAHLTNAARLHKLCFALLGHGPDPAGILQFAPHTKSRLGTARLLLGLAGNPKASLGPSRWPAIIAALTGADGKFAASPATPGIPSISQGSAKTEAKGLVPGFQPDVPASPLKELPCPAGLNLAGYVKAELGLGEAARSMAKACAAANIDVSLVDLGYQTLHPQADHGLSTKDTTHYHSIDLFHVNASHTAQTAKLFEERGPGRNRYTIGLWAWEQPEIPRQDIAAFQYLDEVWAPSTFVTDAIAAVAPLPVFKVPHAVECEPSPGLTREKFGLPEGKILVLVMYDFLSYQYRKNPEAAISAFRLAARKHPELALVIKTINGHKHPEALAKLKDSVADLPGTTFIESFLTRQDTWNLQACCDILLSLHRAEGFGLAPAEMMHLGKAVVATGWSANMDFMTDQNSMPVRFELRPLAHDVGAYPAGPLWAEADIEHAAWCLSRLVTEPALRTDMGRRAALDIKAQLSPATVGATIRQRLSVLGHWYPDLLAPPRIDPRFEALGAHLKSKA
jgi:glycosyltransferase involved in cell wall biosynthesis